MVIYYKELIHTPEVFYFIFSIESGYGKNFEKFRNKNHRQYDVGFAYLPIL